MPVVHLGNPAGLDAGRVMPGHRVTSSVLPDDWSPDQRFNAVTALDGIWRNHSGASAPTWVESDDIELAMRLSAHYGCPLGRSDAEEGEQ